MFERVFKEVQQDGYAVIENFFTDQEVEELKKAGEELTTNIPEESCRTVFSTTKCQQSKDKYFLDSGDKISHFFEEGALDSGGKLIVDAHLSLNKVGHALHWLHPTFKKVTFCERVKEVCYQLGFKEPAIAQSMYIYKNPGIGSEVVPHQDSTFLHTEPQGVIGLWFPLDDATLENGCLWFSPGSHKSGVHRRFVRNSDPNNEDLLVYDRPPPLYSSSNFRAVPVKKGSCVVIHGQVVHKSEENKSTKSRHAYTFHVIETQNTIYSKENWLQPSENEQFPLLYRN